MDGAEPELEWKVRAIAIPAALVLAIAFHAWPTGHFLQRTFLSMIVHELGHAVTAWWSGYGALPTVWKTVVPELRGTITPLIVAAANITGFVVGWKTSRTWLSVLAVVLGALQFVATVGRTPAQAHELITFGGDAGAMVIGTALVLAFFVGPESKLRTNHLRWGFLVIGAAALVDTLSTWWTARTDTDVIPFGEIEGVGKSNPSRLREVWGWTDHQLISRYTTVGELCVVALVAVWAWGVWSARRDARPQLAEPR